MGEGPASEESGPWSGRTHEALDALEVHQGELEDQNTALHAVNQTLQRTNEALVIAHGRFRALYELAPTPYVTVVAGGAIVDLNRAAELILGAPRERLVGTTVEELIHDAGGDRFRVFLAEVFAAGHARCSDVILNRTAKTPVDALIDGVVLREAPGDPPQSVLAIVDITARKLAETARRVAQDEVLAIVSHDLRGPLNAIGLACDALAGDLEPDEHQECVEAIARSSARCERLIKDLLRVAHIESGRLKLEREPFDVGKTVRQVVRDHLSAAAAVSSVLTCLVPDEPVSIVGDRDRLHQIMSNLIGNALVHARGTPIEVSARWHDNVVLIAVTDQGPGIPADELPIVFERYRQGARHHGGAGLGLAIVKGLVEAHHGTATVTSKPGEGARFEISLPRR